MSAAQIMGLVASGQATSRADLSRLLGWAPSTVSSGDISHIRVTAGGDRPCNCGNFGCLETIASGAALVAAVRADGEDVANTADLVRLAHDGNPTVNTNLRFVGRQLGEVLATVVNFFNPQAVVLSGALAGCDTFVAAARGVLYERCLPLTTQELEIGQSVAGSDAGLLGIGRLLIDQGLAAPPVRNDL